MFFLLFSFSIFRSSYLPTEILWGHRFEQMLLYRKDRNKFQVNFSAFHSTFEVDTPVCSARDLERYFTQKDVWERSIKQEKVSEISMNNVTMDSCRSIDMVRM